jgi:hypothetical protein
METMVLPCETWREIIEWLRMHDDDVRHRHADEIEARLDLTPADQALVRMRFGDDICLRSVNWACVQLGIPRPTARGD